MDKVFFFFFFFNVLFWSVKKLYQKLRMLCFGFGYTEVEPISTFVDFGEREFLVADERGYEHLLYKMAEEFLFTSDGKILDSRLQLNKVE